MRTAAPAVPPAARAGAVLSVLAVLAAVAAPARAADCVPAAAVSGDAEAAAEVARALARLGIEAPDAARTCAPVEATVRRDARGLALSLQTGGRAEHRVVADAAVAAAWIESWIRDDAAPLWTAAPAIASRAPSMTRAAPPRRPWWRAPAIAVHAARDLGSGGETWDGLGGEACYGAGAWCAGLAARYVSTTATQSGDPDDGSGGTTASRRTSLAVALTVERRVRAGRATLAPRLSAGLARTVSRRHEPDPPCQSRECSAPITYIGDGFTARNLSGRFGAAVVVAVPLASWLYLDGRLGAEVAAGAHPGVHRHDPSKYLLAEGSPIAAGDPLLDLPGDPRWLVSAGVGLRVEVP